MKTKNHERKSKAESVISLIEEMKKILAKKQFYEAEMLELLNISSTLFHHFLFRYSESFIPVENQLDEITSVTRSIFSSVLTRLGFDFDALVQEAINIVSDDDNYNHKGNC